VLNRSSTRFRWRGRAASRCLVSALLPVRLGSSEGRDALVVTAALLSPEASLALLPLKITRFGWGALSGFWLSGLATYCKGREEEEGQKFFPKFCWKTPSIKKFSS